MFWAKCGILTKPKSWCIYSESLSFEGGGGGRGGPVTGGPLFCQSESGNGLPMPSK